MESWKPLGLWPREALPLLPLFRHAPVRCPRSSCQALGSVRGGEVAPEAKVSNGLLL